MSNQSQRNRLINIYKILSVVRYSFSNNIWTWTIHILYLYTELNETVENAVCRYRTDVDRPSQPQNLTIEKNFTDVSFTWSPSLVPTGPIDYYTLEVNPGVIKVKLPSTILSYQLTIGYKPDAYWVEIVACNIDTDNRTLCGMAISKTFFMQYSTTISPTSRSIATISNAIHIFILTVLCLFFRLMK